MVRKNDSKKIITLKIKMKQEHKSPTSDSQGIHYDLKEVPTMFASGNVHILAESRMSDSL